MTETKNFALKLPDPTDMQNVEDLNENFQKIDGALPNVYVLDLRDHITFDMVNQTGDTFYLLNDGVPHEAVDTAALIEAMRAGRPVKLYVKTLEVGFLIDAEFTAEVLLDNRKEMGKTVYLHGSIYDSFLAISREACSVELWLNSDNTSIYLSYTHHKNASSATYYPLDLSTVLTLGAAEVDVSSAVKPADIKNAFDRRKVIRVQASGEQFVYLPDFAFTGDVEEPTSITVSGIATQGGTHRAELVVDMAAETAIFRWQAIEAEGGAADAVLATNVSVVKAEGTVTITATLKDGGESVTVIDIDENDTPTKITTNGVECPISWEGF